MSEVDDIKDGLIKEAKALLGEGDTAQRVEIFKAVTAFYNSLTKASGKNDDAPAGKSFAAIRQQALTEQVN